jgi:hypothetical protein
MALSPRIVLSGTYLQELEREFSGLKIPRYKFRGYFDEESRVFFDCEGADLFSCLEHVLGRRDFRDFVALLLIRERGSGSLRVMDVSYGNLGTETVKGFIDRYQTQFEPTIKMSLMASGLEYQRLIGYSYEE